MRCLKVMIVDDQTGIRRLLTEYFHSEGWQPVEARNGQEALNLLPESPDVILLDMKMPVMDGLETLRNVRTKEPDLPVVIMTAYGELDLVNQAESLGISAKLSKPFDIEALRDMLVRIHGQRKAG
ncbi:MAG: response regulator [Bacillota bacterium]|jgi:two-component system response regulator (stage 0 sporulation protein F)